MILKLVRTYGVQLCGAASLSVIEILQRFKSKTLRIITDVRMFVIKQILHSDLEIKPVLEEGKSWLETHTNFLT